MGHRREEPEVRLRRIAPLAFLGLALLGALAFWMPSPGRILHGEWEALVEPGPDPQLTFQFGPGVRCMVLDRGVDYSCVYSLKGSLVRLNDEGGCLFARIELKGDPAADELPVVVTWINDTGQPSMAPQGMRLRRVSDEG